MTIEKLARMSQNEFTAIRSEVREGFKGVGERFADVDKRFDAIEDKFDTKFDSLAEVLKMMREDLKDIKGSVITINEDYAELRARVTRLEKKVGLPR